MLEKTAALIKGNLFSAALVIIYIALADYFFGHICPSVILIGLPCPGCGLTRAALSLMLFDFKSAAMYNPMIFAILPLLFVYFILWAKDKNTRILFFPAVGVIIISVIVFFWRLTSSFGTEPLVIYHGAMIYRIFN